MKKFVNAEREAKRMALLRAIRDGKKYTRLNKTLAPLGQAGLIEVLERTATGVVRKLKLSAWGETVLAFYDKEQAKKGKP